MAILADATRHTQPQFCYSSLLQWPLKFMMEHVNIEHFRILTLSFLPWGCCNSFLCFRHLLHIILTHPKLIMHFICTYDSYHLSYTFLKVSWFEKPMDTEKGSGHHYFDPVYWEEFLVSHVISSQLALTRWRHGGSALWDKNWCKVSSKLKIFHHIFIKVSNYSGDNGVNTLHRIPCHIYDTRGQ